MKSSVDKLLLHNITAIALFSPSVFSAFSVVRLSRGIFVSRRGASALGGFADLKQLA
ncbi:MAG: hypothetical protein KAF91_15690 [Nostoc sp. TH1S01]|nr:hypothetical protein [Nostoc sp. TH1S01]